MVRAMIQLERVQRRRSGEAIPAPLRVEVSDRGHTSETIFAKRTHFSGNTVTARAVAFHQSRSWNTCQF